VSTGRKSQLLLGFGGLADRPVALGRNYTWLPDASFRAAPVGSIRAHGVHRGGSCWFSSHPDAQLVATLVGAARAPARLALQNEMVLAPSRFPPAGCFVLVSYALLNRTRACSPSVEMATQASRGPLS